MTLSRYPFASLRGSFATFWAEASCCAQLMPWPRALGIVADRLLMAQRPSFWVEFGARLGKALLPLAWRYVSRRMPPPEEAAWRAAEWRGQGDEWLKEHRRRGLAKSRRGKDASAQTNAELVSQFTDITSDNLEEST